MDAADTEDVGVKIDDLEANGAGHMEVAGSGIAASICSNKAFTMSGLKIATDLSDCLPDGIKIPEMFSAPTRLLSKYSQGRCWPLVGYDMCRTCLRYGRRPKNRRSVLEVTCEAYKCTLCAASPCLPEDNGPAWRPAAASSGAGGTAEPPQR